nr:hypothetical protein [Brevibacterium daeguense]
MFVCTGNTCRSPFAERLATHLDPATRFTSTGTHLLADLGIDPAMADCLGRLGIEDAGFRSRRLDAALLAEADLVVCMTRSHRAWVNGTFPAAAARTVVLKPYAQLVESGAVAPWHPPVAASEPESSPGWLDDVADPYRLGRDEAQRAADEIEAALRRILGR